MNFDGGVTLTGATAFVVTRSGFAINPSSSGDFVQAAIHDAPLADHCAPVAVDANALQLRLFSADGGSPEAGAFGFAPDSGLAPATLQQLSIVQGAPQLIGNATSGTVTVTTLNSNRLVGVFQAELERPDGGLVMLGGSFDIDGCP